MRRLLTLWAALAFAQLAAVDTVAQVPGGVTLIKAARLLDPRSGSVLSPAAVLADKLFGLARSLHSPIVISE